MRTAIVVLLMVLIGICLFGVIYEIFRDRKLSELQAELDEAAGPYHSPADRIKALEADLQAIVDELSGGQEPTGRHSGEVTVMTAKIPVPAPR